MKLFPTLAFITLLVGHPTWALDPFYNEERIAIRGYDPVAYFTLGRATPGRAEINYQWMDVTWQFADRAHRDAFKATPERYAPQYGGYCAYAVSKGSTAPGDPTAWTIHNEKLYLNYSPAVRKRWRRDMEANIAQAD